MKQQAATKSDAGLVPGTPIAGGLLQRKCASCETHAIGGSPCSECSRNKQTLQRSPDVRGRDHAAVPDSVQETLRSPGRPLDASTRAFMESRFQHDFSGVRVHTDAQSAQSAQAVNALAYTVGRDVVFGVGQYAPGTPEGMHLLAHEMAHVVQQGSRAGRPAKKDGLIPEGRPELEQEAHRAAHIISHTRQRPRLSASAGTALYKQAASGPQMTGAGLGEGLSRLIPGMAVERELAPPIKLPTIQHPGFAIKPTLSLVGSLTFGPVNSVVVVSEGDFNAAMGGLANSFSVSFVRDPGGKKIKGVTFTSTLPGIGKHDSQTFTYKPPLTLIWASVFTPPALAFKDMKVEGTVRVQLEVAFEPKLPGTYVPGTSPAPVVNVTPLAVMMMALAVLEKVGLVLGRVASAPIIMLDPELFEARYDRRMES